MQQLSPDLWIVRKEFRLPALGNIGGCATIIRLKPDELVIINPVRFSDEDVIAIKALGQVKFVIAPNPLHHLFLLRTQKLFAGSKIAGPREVEYRNEDVDFDIVLNENALSTWEPILSVLPVKAKPPLYQELLFFHHPSRALIMTDLVFNIQRVDNWLNALALKLYGAYRQLTTTRLSRIAFKHESLRKTMQQVHSLQPEILVVAHGDPVLENANERLKDSFQAWLK